MTATTPSCAVVDLVAVRAALTARLQTAQYQGQALRVNEWFADVLNPPCVLVGSFAMTWEDDTYNGLPSALVAVRLVVPATANRPAQQDLDQLQVAYADVLFADASLGGVVRLCRPLRSIGNVFTRGNQEFPCADCDTLIIF